MIFDPRAIFFLAVLVGVTGWVLRGLLASWYKLSRDSSSSRSLADMDERLRKIEAATSGLITEVASIREKERFMARLQASATTRENQPKTASNESELSPMVTQAIPVTPRSPRY